LKSKLQKVFAMIEKLGLQFDVTMSIAFFRMYWKKKKKDKEGPRRYALIWRMEKGKMPIDPKDIDTLIDIAITELELEDFMKIESKKIKYEGKEWDALIFERLQ